MFRKHIILFAIALGLSGSVVAQLPTRLSYVAAVAAATTTIQMAVEPKALTLATVTHETPTTTAQRQVGLAQPSPLAQPTRSDGASTTAGASIYQVPFYSQFADITSPKWQKVGCGITSLAMLVDYYGQAVPVNTLLQEGIDDHAYLASAGWTYAGLIKVGEAHGITGQAHDLGGLNKDKAFAVLEQALKKGPVMVGVRYLFEPNNPIPHLVIADGVKDGRLYYNDPAGQGARGSVSIARFKSAWRGRYIEFWPVS